MRLPSNQSLTVFFPFYNDAGTVEKMITDAYHFAGKLTNDLEVIAINDGSQDHTLTELKNMKALYPNLKIVDHIVNRGYGGAIISGINNSTKHWVFYTDGDAQYHLDDLEKLWNLKNGYDIINGFKIKRSDNFVRKWVGIFYRLVIKAIFKTKILDVDCDYRLMNGTLVRSLDLKCTSGAITVELVNKFLFKTDKLLVTGINHYPRVYGSSTFFTFKNILKTFRDEFILLKELKNTKQIIKNEDSELY